MSRLLFLTLTILFLTSTYQQVADVITFVDSNTSISRTRREAETILSTFKWSNYLKKSDFWEYIDVGTVYNGYIRIFQFNLQNTNFNFTSNPFNINSQDITISGKNEIKIVFTFDYQAKTGIVTSPKGTGLISLISRSFNFTKREIKPQDGVHSILATFSIDWDFQAIITTGGDDISKGYFDKAKENYRTGLLKNITINLQKEVDYYYDNQSRSRIDLVQVNTTFPLNTKYNVKLDYFSDPSYNQDGVTFYWSSNVTRSSPVKFLAPVNRGINFNNTLGAFQVYIRYRLLRPIFQDISKSEKFFFNVRNNNLPKSINFLRLDVEHLGQVIPNIYNSRARDENIIINANVVNIVLDPINSLKGTCDIRFDVISSDGITVLFKWISNFRYELYAFNDMNVLDFNLKIKSVDLLDSTVVRNDFGFADINLLNEWIENSFNAYLTSDNSYNLFKKSVDLSSFFVKPLLNFQNYEDGLLIGGNPRLTNSTMEELNQLLHKKVEEAL